MEKKKEERETERKKKRETKRDKERIRNNFRTSSIFVVYGYVHPCMLSSDNGHSDGGHLKNMGPARLRAAISEAITPRTRDHGLPCGYTPSMLIISTFVFCVVRRLGPIVQIKPSRARVGVLSHDAVGRAHFRYISFSLRGSSN